MNEYEIRFSCREGKLEALWVYADDPTRKQYFTSVTRVYGETLKETSATIWHSSHAKRQVHSRFEQRRQALRDRLA